jgi:hypothetical protein
MINNRFTFLLLLVITCCSRPVSCRIYQTIDAIIVEGIVTPVFLYDTHLQMFLLIFYIAFSLLHTITIISP